MSLKHGTPSEVVEILRRHIPRNVKTILEPSVGAGALLDPLVNGGFGELREIVAIDINKKSLEAARDRLSALKRNIKYICDDFLNVKIEPFKFDCVIMNPPFDAKKSSYVLYEGKRIPIELAFFEKALNAVRDGGAIIAVLPGSLITSNAREEYRKTLLKSVRVKKVYELNQYTFPQIEGRFYLLIAKKTVSEREIHFQKPFCDKSVLLRIPKREVIEGSCRLDFSYHFSRLSLLQAYENQELNWVDLGDVADIRRGDFSSPDIPNFAIHSTSWKDGQWENPVERSQANRILVEQGDILLKRVSRGCEQSFGLYKGRQSSNFSDCVFRIRLNIEEDPASILFAIRALYANEIGKNVFVKGSGASFISRADLQKLKVPIRLAKKFPKDFHRYKSCLDVGAVRDMIDIEKKMFNKILCNG